jgi:uncharacterized protein (DUF433 family)
MAEEIIAVTRVRWQDRITVNEDIHHGTPCISGTRVSVAVVLGSLADGMANAEILAEYPQLSEDDIAAALAYAAEVMRQEIVLPLSA